MTNKNRLISYFIIISIIILITSINVNSQWSPYMGFNFYGNPYGYGWNQPYIFGYNSYSLNLPYNYGLNMHYNNSGFFPPYGYYYGSNFSYGTNTTTFENSFFPPYGPYGDYYSLSPGYAMPTSNNPNYQIWNLDFNFDPESHIYYGPWSII